MIKNKYVNALKELYFLNKELRFSNSEKHTAMEQLAKNPTNGQICQHYGQVAVRTEKEIYELVKKIRHFENVLRDQEALNEEDGLNDRR